MEQIERLLLMLDPSFDSSTDIKAFLHTPELLDDFHSGNFNSVIQYLSELVQYSEQE